MKHLLTNLLATACVMLASATFAAETNNPASTNAAADDEKTARPARTSVRREESPLAYLGISIPVLFIVIGGAWLALHTWCDFRKRRLLIELHHRERMIALEKGLDLPPLPADLLEAKEEADEPVRPESSLSDGLWWLGVGIGLVIWLSLSSKPWTHPAVAAIPIGIGLAQLIYYCLKGRDAKPPVK